MLYDYKVGRVICDIVECIFIMWVMYMCEFMPWVVHLEL